MLDTSFIWEMDCTMCMGYGLWPDDMIPLTLQEAKEYINAMPCTMCGRDNIYCDDNMNKKDSKTKEDFETFMLEFEKDLRCVELSDMREQNLLPET